MTKKRYAERMGSATAAPPEQPQEYRASRPGSGVLGSHPMRERMVAAILEGATSTAIHKWVSPKVSRVTISELARVVREQHQAALILEKAKQLQGIATQGDENLESVKNFTRQAVMGSEHLARIERLLTPLERQVALADSVNDRQGLSAVAKTALSAIRTQAELDGSLLQSSAPAVQANNFFVFPSIVVNHSGNPVNPPVTLDVTPETIERD